MSYNPSFEIFTGTQVDQLSLVANLHCAASDPVLRLEPGVYSIRAADEDADDFSFRVQAVAPPP